MQRREFLKIGLLGALLSVPVWASHGKTEIQLAYSRTTLPNDTAERIAGAYSKSMPRFMDELSDYLL